jgi:hypothetical protein
MLSREAFSSEDIRNGFAFKASIFSYSVFAVWGKFGSSFAAVAIVDCDWGETFVFTSVFAASLLFCMAGSASNHIKPAAMRTLLPAIDRPTTFERPDFFTALKEWLHFKHVIILFS